MKPELSPVRVQASRGWAPLRLGELAEYRELIYFFVWRDLKVRYKQTVLGAMWAVLQPGLITVVFSIFFGRLAGVPSDGLPYPLFAFCAMVPWMLFSQGLSQGTGSLTGSEHLIKKVYFPRLVLPIAAVLHGGMDFLLSFAVLVGLMAWYGQSPGTAVVWVPLLVLLALVTALGASLWLAALNVQFRDVRHTMAFLTQLWFFATPVVYPGSLLPEPWRLVYGINPMAGVVEGFRWTLLGGPAPGAMLGVSAATALVLLVSGAFFFRRLERTFADVV